MINYYLLTKPGIILGNLLTVAAGFLLASKDVFHVGLFLATLTGLALVMASACVFNNFIDRQIDKKMERTKNRAFAKGLISPYNAILFAIFIGILGEWILFLYTNVLTLFIANLGFFIYVVLYSLWKCHTVYGTAIGSIAGAIPPVVGYCAVSNHFDIGAFLLFSMLVLWQMPHFFSIALYHYEDYATAGIPTLPIAKGIIRTKIHMIFYIVGFIGAAFMLTFFNYTSNMFLIVASVLGLFWLGLSIKGFASSNDQKWGKQMFQLSLVIIVSICFIISFDKIL